MVNRTRDVNWESWENSASERLRISPVEGDSAPPWQGPPPSHLLLDLCGVLVDDTHWSRWLFQLVSRIGLHSHYQLFWRVWQQDYQTAINRGERDYQDALREFLAGSGLSRGQIDEVCYAALARRRHLDETARPFPGVKTNLVKLQSRGWRLGVIANSPRTGRQVQNWLESMGLASPFELIVSSRDLSGAEFGANRYQQSATAWQLSVTQIAFVSANPLEIAQAEAGGMRTISMPRASGDSERQAIDGLEELVAWRPAEQTRTRAG